MTDRGRSALKQSSDFLRIGPSNISWDNGKLVISVDEISSLPAISRVKGTIVIEPSAISKVELPLTEDGTHVWRPFAPNAKIYVELNRNGWQWQGHGYFDANFGTKALEEDFSYWTWGRYPTENGCICFYDALRRDGTDLQQAIFFDHKGIAETVPLPPKAKMKRSLWAVYRQTRADKNYQPVQVLNMLDAPFYSRSAVKTKIFGRETIGVHEALDLARFRSPFIKPILAVRVPRRTNWSFKK